MKYMVIIPARYASSRFPGKPLAMLGDKPIIQWVYERASSVFDLVYVATDDTRIADAVEAFGGRFVLTSSDCQSGTDRVYQAFVKLGCPADVVINVQGDEPFIRPEQLRLLAGCFESADTDIATLVRSLSAGEPLADPNKVKAVVAADGRALYFSRSVVPFCRSVETQQWPEAFPYRIHIGLYGYRADVLCRIAGMPPSALEKAESLEQLRWLEAGMCIRAAVTDVATVGIDTPADLEDARRMLEKGLIDNA